MYGQICYKLWICLCLRKTSGNSVMYQCSTRTHACFGRLQTGPTCDVFQPLLAVSTRSRNQDVCSSESAPLGHNARNGNVPSSAKQHLPTQLSSPTRGPKSSALDSLWNACDQKLINFGATETLTDHEYLISTQRAHSIQGAGLRSRVES